MRRQGMTGFSLLEVVLAVGIFAVAVVTMLALLTSLTRQTAESADALSAQRLPDGLRIELQRVANGSFDALAGAVPLMGAPLDNGLQFVATRDASRVQSVTFRPPLTGGSISPDEQYFLVEVWRFNQAPLAYDPAAAVLPLYVRVSGPYRNPGSTTPTALADRTQFTFTLAIDR